MNLLTRASRVAALFLASINVMDYSLLVGMVQTSGGHGASGGAAAAGGGNTITVSDGRGEEWTLMVRPDEDRTPAIGGSSSCRASSDALLPSLTPASAPSLTPASSLALSSQVGLIDYCRQFTWKEEAESRIKRATVIQPKQYKRRFREALHRYFMASIEKYGYELHGQM